jgi:hypothetical protein
MEIKTFRSTSQHNEDGLLLWIFSIIPECEKYCVEFGAWDGKYLSNTFNLIANHGWSGLLIEGNKKRVEALKKNYPFKDKIIAVNRLVGWSSKDSLDSILSEYNIPDNFDLLSIDIDNNDYHVWKALTRFQPKVVVIEFNSEIPNDIEFIQEADQKVYQGTSLKSMVLLAKEKGYQLVEVTSTNAFFVDSKYYDLFKITDNSLETINPQKPFPRVYQLFDGTVVLTESFKLRWSNFDVGIYDLQKIPYLFRNHNPNIFTRIFRRLFKRVLYKILLGDTINTPK